MLAVLRPVFRGLRRDPGRPEPEEAIQTCSAETRFQGIATCTKYLGPTSRACPRLAVLRPVFRGLRRLGPAQGHAPGDNLQC